MATLDDKILGEKLQNYCSSSSEDDEDETDENRKPAKSKGSVKFIPEAQAKEQEEAAAANSNFKGSAKNTGPKGVIKDWQRFKQLEHEKNAEAQRERVQLCKKLALTCRSDDLDKELSGGGGGNGGAAAAATSAACKPLAAAGDFNMDELESELLQDAFFQEYLKQKIADMQKRSIALPRFGSIVELTSDNFLDQIEQEHKQVTIIIHIYDQKIAQCKLMNSCLEAIAADYCFTKFCKVKSVDISLSDKFRQIGCPALLIYKNAELIGNFVKLIDEFGDEFCASDVENFLLEQGFLPSQDGIGRISSSIRNGSASASAAARKEANSDDSD